MRIAYFLDLPEGLGGAGSLLLKQAYLMSKIHWIEVVIPCNHDGVPNREYKRRCELQKLRYTYLNYPTAFNFYSVDLLETEKSKDNIIKYLTETKIEFIHSTQLNVALECASRMLGIPHLMNIYQLSDAEFKLYYGDIYAHYHLCDSQLYCEKWKNNLPLKSRVLRPISPISEIKKKYIMEKEEYKILLVGRVCPRKNQLVAIKILEKLKKRYKLKLIIAGELVEDYATDCQNYAIANGLIDFVEFTDFVSDVASFLEESDIFLCTSYDESFPSSMVEAVAYGLAVVTTPVGGVPEVFKNEYNAFVSSDFSEIAIMKALLNCISSIEDGRVDLVLENAKKTWNENFSPQMMIKELNDYYCEICAENIHREPIYKYYIEANSLYKELLSLDTGLTIYKSRILYLMKLIKELPGGKVYIWGAGTCGYNAYIILTHFRSDIIICGFIDRKKKGKYIDLPIIEPEEIPVFNFNMIIISYKGKTEDTILFLENKGYKRNESIWMIN